MGMTKYCWGGLVVLLFLVYLEYNVRKDWINSLTKDDVLNYLSNTFKWPTLYQLSLFPAYVAILFIGTLIVPGSHHVGTPIADGRKITFKINGLTLFFLLIIGGAVAHFTGVLPGTVIYDNFSSLFLIVNASAFLVSIYLYVAGTMKGEGKGKSFFDNFVIGTELMPFVFGQPLKMFWLKPSMMGWACINLSFLAKQYEILGHVSTPMILYQAFSLFYIIDYFYHEERMTSTWDIIAEHFGLMLVWGDIVFIPFVFSAQCWFLLHDDTHLEIWQIALMVLLFLTGYTIFRGCNSQKHEFKHNPKTLIWGKPAETIAGKLLVSGWWGVARHINYTGDILLGLGFSIPCLFHSVLPWVYPIYLTLLLVHREVRDHHRCHEKYGKTWDLYVKRVPYRMIPYIY